MTTISEMSNYESYPPPFRPQNFQSLDVSEDPIQDPDDDPVPSIDLQCLSHDKLEEACREWGLFRLVNHGIPLNLSSQLQEIAKQLFSTSFESKRTASASPVTYFWGTPALSPSGAALKRGTQNINWVEGFNIPLGQLTLFQPQLPMLDSFRLLLLEYGNHLSRIATTLFKAIAKNLNLNPEASNSYLSEATGIVRVYRYPHCSEENAALGMEVHTDSSVLSILDQDVEVSGLELHKDDRWLTVKPISTTLIVNLGDMMQAISNDKYKSVKHRVKVNKHRERMSICYFVFPDEDTMIQSSKYKAFTYNDFRAQVQQDIKILGYKVGLERFRRTPVSM